MIGRRYLRYWLLGSLTSAGVFAVVLGIMILLGPQLPTDDFGPFGMALIFVIFGFAAGLPFSFALGVPAVLATWLTRNSSVIIAVLTVASTTFISHFVCLWYATGEVGLGDEWKIVLLVAVPLLNATIWSRLRPSTLSETESTELSTSSVDPKLDA